MEHYIRKVKFLAVNTWIKHRQHKMSIYNGWQNVNNTCIETVIIWNTTNSRTFANTCIESVKPLSHQTALWDRREIRLKYQNCQL